MSPAKEPRSKMGIFESSGKHQLDDNGVRFQKEDLEVDIMEWGNQSDYEFQEEEEDLPQASSSSSFGDSGCNRDDFGLGDGDEVQSLLCKDYPLSDETEFFGTTKKKTNDHWRKSVRSIMWRCKWLEIKVKELQSQARGYDKEVLDYSLSKQFDLEKSKLQGLEGKSIPFHESNHRMNVFKRRRRKRVEATTDVSAYMSSHNIFSYTAKRVPVNPRAQYRDSDFGACRKAMGKQDEIEDDRFISELDCSDVSIAKLMCKIDEVQGKARKLRNRVDQILCDSKTAHNTSLIPQTIEPRHRDLTVQNSKQCGLVEDQLTREQSLAYNSPISSKSLRLHSLEDMLMDEPEMNDDEVELDDEKLDYFMKLINEITGGPSEEEDEEEEDPKVVTKKRKTSQ